MSRNLREAGASGVGLRARSAQISSAGDSHVRTSRAPAIRPGSTASTPPCGSSSLESFAWYDPASWLWKTSQLSLIAGSGSYSETWPRAGMIRSGTAFRLPPSAPLTAAIGSSWSRGEYPTPSATPCGSAQNEGQAPHDRPSAGTPSLFSWARQWPTATAGDAKASGSRRKGSDKAHAGTSLTDLAVRQWATPTSNSADRGRRTQEGAANEVARGRSPDLTAQALMWATPTTNRAARRSSDRRDEEPLPGQAKRWPTPLARDSKGRPQKARDNQCSLPVDALSHQRQTTCSHGGECRPTLNPRFVEWLMGFPPGWTMP